MRGLYDLSIVALWILAAIVQSSVAQTGSSLLAAGLPVGPRLLQLADTYGWAWTDYNSTVPRPPPIPTGDYSYLSLEECVEGAGPYLFGAEEGGAVVTYYTPEQKVVLVNCIILLGLEDRVAFTQAQGPPAVNSNSTTNVMYTDGMSPTTILQSGCESTASDETDETDSCTSPPANTTIHQDDDLCNDLS